jgi:hypothetical protein
MDSPTSSVSPSCDTSVVRRSIDRIHTTADGLLNSNEKVLLKPSNATLLETNWSKDRGNLVSSDINGTPVICSDYYDRAVKYWPLRDSPQGIECKYAQWISDCMNYLAQKAPNLQFNAFWSTEPNESYIKIVKRKGQNRASASPKFTAVTY